MIFWDTLYTIQLYTIQDTLYTIQDTLYTIHPEYNTIFWDTLYTIQLFTNNFFKNNYLKL